MVAYTVRNNFTLVIVLNKVEFHRHICLPAGIFAESASQFVDK